MALQFIDAEKRVNGMLVFPAFSMTVEKGQVAAIDTDVNIKNALLNILLGRTSLSHGEIRFDKEELNVRQHISFFSLEIDLYERLTIEEMLKFTKNLFDSDVSVETILEMLQLNEKKRIKISELSYSEKKRVQLACLTLQNREVFVLEEPDQNLDLESRRIYLSLLEHLRKLGKTILILTGNLESAVTAADQVFKLNDRGLTKVQMDSEISDNGDDVEDVKQISFDKIPSKVHDKIVLFHPPEIDYIESIDGQTYLFVHGESFPCNLTLQKLEERLIPFGFFRCHRSYIVNLQKVREVITWSRNSYSLVLENREKSSIPLSKTKMSELKEMMGI